MTEREIREFIDELDFSDEIKNIILKDIEIIEYFYAEEEASLLESIKEGDIRGFLIEKAIRNYLNNEELEDLEDLEEEKEE